MLTEYFYSKKRNKALAQSSDDQMRDFLNAPCPSRKALLSEVEFLAVDLEMSGLDASQDQILSIGYVPIVNNRIILNRAQNHVIDVGEVDLQSTAPIHQIRNIDLQNQGERLEDAMAGLLVALKGRVLLLHHAPLDGAFLHAACRQLYQDKLYSPFIDTLQVERDRNKRHASKAHLSVRLSDTRQRYNLPDYSAHNAVIDAIATAELWLAQQAHLTSDMPTKLSHFVKYT